MTAGPAALAGLLLSFAAWAKAADAPASRGILVRAIRLSPPAGGVLLLLLVWLQAALGFALLLGEAGVVRPTFLLVGLLALFSLEALFAGRISRCGCYGPRLSQRTAWILDGLLLVSLLLADRPMGWPAPGPLAASLAVGGLAAGLALFTSRYGRLLPRPQLRVGRRLPDDLGQAAGRRLLLVVSPACPLCAAWKKLLAARSALGDFPPIGLVSSSEDETDDRWPVLVVERPRMERLVGMLPTAVLVENGVVRQRWAGLPPAEWAAEVRRAQASG